MHYDLKVAKDNKLVERIDRDVRENEALMTR